MIYHDYPKVKMEENAIVAATSAAKAKAFALIVNLPEALDETIKVIEFKNKYKEKMSASTESGAIAGRRKN